MKPKTHKKEWIQCPKCGVPIHKDRGCSFCDEDYKPKELKDPHYFVEDDILAYQFHSLKKTDGAKSNLFYLCPPFYDFPIELKRR